MVWYGTVRYGMVRYVRTYVCKILVGTFDNIYYLFGVFMLNLMFTK